MRQATNQELSDRMDQFDQKLDRLLQEFRDEMRDVKQSLVQVEKDVSETRDIVQAWGAVKAAGKFAKWLGSAAGGLVAAYLMIKAVVQHLAVGK